MAAMAGKTAERASDQVLRLIHEGVRILFKISRPPPHLLFHNGINMQDATTPAQLTFLEGEVARFVESGTWEFGTCRKWVSKLFLVPKLGVNQWRGFIDLRVLNYCVRKRLKMETLLRVLSLTKAQYLLLGIPAARFFMRELHSVGDRWGGRVRMTPQLRRDLQWFTSVPVQSNGKPIHRPVETAYLHTDMSSYGWGGVLNGRLEARGF
eukprot:jgi/Tetstr1/434668/TSEL_023759.t1